ncbi:DUF4238 domain-containing protein [Sphingomonas kyeonggiensis]|uniref:DUF4238 domain-containing protein n=1 Tax=Sphingomonas kyeonggiensis TaxID=1268553 RepID=A0A7W6JNR2_9SPHN|nr:DUF4238 domain-containing protein [Sphingomonas kyeonggiensis]MBB4096673.1 hypothetical protein [Sphingomonas kyeonggiensis]
MPAPRKHHYLPQFFIKRWANADGRVVEYRRPRDDLIRKLRYPAETGYLIDLYANEAEADPVRRQALETLFMQRVDDGAAEALREMSQTQKKPTDPALRDAWSRFLMSLIHRSPRRVEYLTQRVRQYEEGELNPNLRAEYTALRGPDDPEDFDQWLAEQGPLAPELRVRLIRLLIDSPRIGGALNAMHWRMHSLEHPRFGLLSSDQPLLLSNGLGHGQSFAVLATSPTQVFLAARDQRVIDGFRRQRPSALETGLNDACVRQAAEMVVAHSDTQRTFVDRRLLKTDLALDPNTGLPSWNPPIIDLHAAAPQQIVRI